jgi:hypothetical protein
MPLPRNGFVQPVEGVSGGVPIPVIPTGSAANKTAVNFTTVEIVDHTLAYPGPNIAIPPGYQVVCALRLTMSFSPVGYVAGTQPNVLVAASRKEIVKGFLLAFQIQNMNEIFFGSDTDHCIWELYAEAP